MFGCHERFVISHMTARAASVKSMKSGKSFSQERQDPLTKSLLLKHPYYNMLKELSSKVVLYRARPCLSSPDCQVHLGGNGSLNVIAGCLTGRHSRKPRTLAISSFNVALKLVVVKHTVSARKSI